MSILLRVQQYKCACKKAYKHIKLQIFVVVTYTQGCK